MLSSQLFQNRDMVIDEARPNRNHHKRVFRGRVGVDTKPRLFVPQRSKHSSNKMKATTTIKPAPTQQPLEPAPLNALIWMEKSCPMDVIPIIISYAGPQMAQSLNYTNKFWYSVFQDESTWKQMCEELYKVRYMLMIYNCIHIIAFYLTLFTFIPIPVEGRR